MIDAEVKIFNRAYETVAPLCAPKGFVSTYVDKPTVFPTAALYELDNMLDKSRQTSTPIENFAVITYQLDVYAKTKSKCREVASTADEAMIAMNFNRISGQFIQNDLNQQVFRYTARYEVRIDRDGNLYRIP